MRAGSTGTYFAGDGSTANPVTAGLTGCSAAHRAGTGPTGPVAT